MSSPSPPPLRAFPERHRAALHALVVAMFGSERLFGDRAAMVVGEVDDHLAEVSPLLRFALVFLLDVVRILPLVVLRRFALFESLSADEQHALLEAVERSPRLGLPLLPYKTLLTIAFYELPGELESVGYGKARRRHLLAPPSLGPGARLR